VLHDERRIEQVDSRLTKSLADTARRTLADLISATPFLRKTISDGLYCGLRFDLKK
jgi:hypothetical protein